MRAVFVSASFIVTFRVCPEVNFDLPQLLYINYNAKSVQSKYQNKIDMRTFGSSELRALTKKRTKL
jgi:hypothetical protein